jgi:uncharacterized protein YcfJ
MIRTMMTRTMTTLAVGLFTLTGVSAMAAPVVVHHHGKTTVVAQAEGAAPAGDATKPQKKAVKKVKVTKPAKDKTAADGAAPTTPPAAEKAPEKK